MPLFVGLISGTSVDGIDAALVDIGEQIRPLATCEESIPAELRERALQANHDDRLRQTLELDVSFGRLLASAALNLLEQCGVKAEEVTAIGSHGQTICHYPDGDLPFSFQIGDPNLIAELTGITTVADFRRRDIAAGGQGAPLASAFHDALFRSADTQPVVANIGGIANITVIGADAAQPTFGFDTGPGNGLLDAWVQQHLGQTMDLGARWARSGQVVPDLLEHLCRDPYFELPPPKSTGKEHFNLAWLQPRLDTMRHSLEPADVQRTLVELSTATIAAAVIQSAPAATELLVCGGGAHNDLMLESLQQRLPALHVASTTERGIDPDYMEAMAFAWLASQTLNHKPGNLPSVTGASHPVVLGATYPGSL